MFCNRTRREFLWEAGGGFTGVALAGMLGADGFLANQAVAADGVTLSGKRTFIDAGPGTPDGFRLDVDGNLWCGWGMGRDDLDGVHVFSPQGKLIGRIRLPERCANLCFGGPARNRLFMAASTSIYSLYVNTQGAVGG